MGARRGRQKIEDGDSCKPTMLPEQEKVKESIKEKMGQLVWKNLELSNLMVDYALKKGVMDRLSKELDILKNDLEGSWEESDDVIEGARQF